MIPSPTLRIARLRAPLRGAALGMLLAAAVTSHSADGDEYLPPLGGPGGVHFNAECPPPTYLAGFSAHAGDDVDSVQPFCADVRPDGSRGEVFGLDRYGGGGGSRHPDGLCPPEAGFVTALVLSWEGKETIVINSIYVLCLPMWPAPGAQPVSVGIAGPVGVNETDIFDDIVGFAEDVSNVLTSPGVLGVLSGGAYGATVAAVDLAEDGDPDFLQWSYDHEPDAAEGWNRGRGAVACMGKTTPAGMTIRAGIWLDALGIICRPAPPQPPTLSRDRPLVRSSTIADAAQRAGPNPIANVPIQQSVPVDSETTRPAGRGPVSSVPVEQAPQTPGGDRGIIIVGGNQTAEASASRSRSTVDPSTPVALNPQPLPPRAAPPELREPAILDPSAATSTRASTGRAATADPTLGAQQILGTQPAAAAAPGAAQILCRGGRGMRLEQMSADLAAGLGRVRAPGAETYSLYFATSQGVVVNADGNGLQASSCAFLGQAWRLEDPPAIRFDANPAGPFFYDQPPRADETSNKTSVLDRPHYLDQPDNYWLFTVKPAYGMFEASSHAAWMPRPGTQAAGEVIAAGRSPTIEGATAVTPEERDRARRETRVIPTASGVRVQFVSQANLLTPPSVAVGTSPPRLVAVGSQRRLDNPVATVWATEHPENARGETLWWVGEVRDGTLAPDTEYHYLVSMSEGGSMQLGPFQIYGTFRTLPRAAAGEPPSAPDVPAPSAVRRIPPNLFAMDDAAIVVVGGRETTAGTVKSQVLAEVGQLPEATRAFVLCSLGLDAC